MRFSVFSILLALIFAGSAHAQLIDPPVQPIFIALPTNLVPIYNKVIKARFLPGTNEYTIQIVIDLPKMHLPPNGIEVHSWKMKSPIASINGETFNAFDRFFQSSMGSVFKDKQSYINFDMRYHVYSLSSPAHKGRSFEVAPILESTVAVHQDFDLRTINLQSNVAPALAGAEWTMRYNKKRNKIIVSWRVSAGFGLTMQNQHIQNYYPAVNTGFLLTF